MKQPETTPHENDIIETIIENLKVAKINDAAMNRKQTIRV